MAIRVIHGDCRDVLPTLDRIDCVVTDPPYGIGMMNKHWDKTGVAFQPDTWWPVFTAMKPGAHLVAFGSTRTFHRLVCAIEDAGFEIRDTLCWHFATGFPKSHNISAAIDRTLGAEREVVGRRRNRKADSGNQTYAALGEFRQSAYSDITAPATPEAAQWQGWGSALKPAVELICLARRPLDGTLAQNTLKHGVGGLHIDACRIEGRERTEYGLAGASRTAGNVYGKPSAPADFDSTKGRWPANVLHDGSDEVLEAFAAYGERSSRTKQGGQYGRKTGVHDGGHRVDGTSCYADICSPARFFYSSKADKSDRADSRHPTIKPVDLMRWLVRLVCPPGGTVLDPFAGSGSTGEAAMLEGMNAILVERDPQHCVDIRHRIRRWSGEDCPLFAEVAD